MLFSRFFGYGRKIRKLRKKWDRLREKSLKKNESVRQNILNRLDQIEQNIRVLEERNLSRWETARLVKETEIELAEIEAMVKADDEEILHYMKGVNNE